MLRSISLISAMSLLCATAQDVQPPFNCINNAPSLLSSCGGELEVAGQVVPLNVTTAATADQLASLSEAWTEADKPTAACCQTLKQFADAACVCDPSLQALLPSVGVNIEPITAVLGAAGEACGTFTVAPCP